MPLPPKVDYIRRHTRSHLMRRPKCYMLTGPILRGRGIAIGRQTLSCGRGGTVRKITRVWPRRNQCVRWSPAMRRELVHQGGYMTDGASIPDQLNPREALGL